MILELAESSFSGLDPQSHKEYYENMENNLQGEKTNAKFNTLELTT